uniref:Uncharacterized protein n=1 Tax=Romanomermis culicivorax TaxID=13658 RepID=A0A915L7H6_ROMCU
MTSAYNLVTNFAGVGGSNIVQAQPDSLSGYSKCHDQLNDSKKIIALLEVIAQNTTKSVQLLEKLTLGQISEQAPTIITFENENVILDENSKISKTNGQMTETEINRPTDSLSRSNPTMVNDIFLEKVKAIPTELYMNSSINEERHRATISGANDGRGFERGGRGGIPEFVLNAHISNTQAYPINYLIRVLKPDTN